MSLEDLMVKTINDAVAKALSGRPAENATGDIDVKYLRVLSHDQAREFCGLAKNSNQLLNEPLDVLPRVRRHSHRNGGESTKGFGFRLVHLINYQNKETPIDVSAHISNMFGTTSAHGLKKVK